MSKSTLLNIPNARSFAARTAALLPKDEHIKARKAAFKKAEQEFKDYMFERIRHCLEVKGELMARNGVVYFFIDKKGLSAKFGDFPAHLLLYGHFEFPHTSDTWTKRTLLTEIASNEGEMPFFQIQKELLEAKGWYLIETRDHRDAHRAFFEIHSSRPTATESYWHKHEKVMWDDPKEILDDMPPLEVSEDEPESKQADE